MSVTSDESDDDGCGVLASQRNMARSLFRGLSQTLRSARQSVSEGEHHSHGHGHDHIGFKQQQQQQQRSQEHHHDPSSTSNTSLVSSSSGASHNSSCLLNQSSDSVADVHALQLHRPLDDSSDSLPGSSDCGAYGGVTGVAPLSRARPVPSLAAPIPAQAQQQQQQQQQQHSTWRVIVDDGDAGRHAVDERADGDAGSMHDCRQGGRQMPAYSHDNDADDEDEGEDADGSVFVDESDESLRSGHRRSGPDGDETEDEDEEEVVDGDGAAFAGPERQCSVGFATTPEAGDAIFLSDLFVKAASAAVKPEVHDVRKRVSFKLGDLGLVTEYNDKSAEEGDSRYLARVSFFFFFFFLFSFFACACVCACVPVCVCARVCQCARVRALFVAVAWLVLHRTQHPPTHPLSRPQEVLQNRYTDLRRADMFSIGCTMYELASLQLLAGNGSSWHRLRDAPEPLEGYSTEFSDLVLSMLSGDSRQRPTAADVLKHPLLRPEAEKSTKKKLEQALNRVKELEEQYVA